MTNSFTEFLNQPVVLAIIIVAFVVGLWLGMLLRSGAKRRAIRLDEQVNLLAAERDTLRKELETLRVERDSLDQRLTPLAAEIDRLKRIEAKRLEPRADGPVVAAAATAMPIEADDVRRLKGVGDRFAAALAKLGITGVAQIAAWSGADADVIDSQLGSFAGRIRTDRLVEQARLLHDGRTTEYEIRFGALGT